MESIELEVRTGHEPAIIDMTSEANSFCQDKGDGLLSVFIPHATAGIAIFETVPDEQEQQEQEMERK